MSMGIMLDSVASIGDTPGFGYGTVAPRLPVVAALKGTVRSVSEIDRVAPRLDPRGPAARIALALKGEGER